jgi:hypothetical protein
METIRIASFDPGKKNFAFYIEEFDEKELECVHAPATKNERYCANGELTPVFKEIVNNVCRNGRTIMFKNTDLTLNCKTHSYLEDEYLHNLTDLLDSYISEWDKCSAIIIEKQMSFGKRHNTMALKIAQHCWSYFAFKYGRFKDIVEFPAYHKTQVLGACKLEKRTKTGKVSYKAVDKPTRKKWSIQQAIAILNDRNDETTLSSLTTVRKKDDLADVLCQAQAYKILTYIPIICPSSTNTL